MAETETTHLEVEQTSLLLELGAAKDEVSSLHSQESKDEEAMEEDYQKALELIFSYAMDVVCSNTTFLETNQRLQMVCRTPLTHFLQSSLRTPGATWPWQPLRSRQ